MEPSVGEILRGAAAGQETANHAVSVTPCMLRALVLRQGVRRVPPAQAPPPPPEVPMVEVFGCHRVSIDAGIAWHYQGIRHRSDDVMLRLRGSSMYTDCSFSVCTNWIVFCSVSIANSRFQFKVSIESRGT